MISAAGIELERHGFHGTDSNRIARAAGYAPGTFYKHFADKTEVFLAVYDDWVSNEWKEVEVIARASRTRQETAMQVIDFLVEHHRRWQGFRATLRGLVATDARVRIHHRAARARQLVRFQALSPAYAEPGVAGLLMLYIERVCDALADQEAKTLEISEDHAKRSLVAMLLGKI